MVGKTEGKGPLERPLRKWEGNTKMVLEEFGCGDMGWIGPAQSRNGWWALVNAVMNLRVP